MSSSRDKSNKISKTNKSDKKEEIVNMIMYIKHNVIDLSINERKDILQMIINSGIEDNKVQSKGNGTQIKFKDLQSDVIVSIHKYMQTKMKEKLENLKNFTEENEIPEEETA
jgi:hypothetical protein